MSAWDRALLASEQTVFDTSWLRERIAVIFRYLTALSTTLVSDVLDAEEIERAHAVGDGLVEYVMTREDLEQGHTDRARGYIERYPNSPYGERLAALLLMREGNYPAAQEALEKLLAKDELTFGLLLYEVFGDLETCYRKNDDYKRAYEFSGSRIGLLERLLEEI
jgi:tetratricopeptide (TPR) repeat protein